MLYIENYDFLIAIVSNILICRMYTTYNWEELKGYLWFLATSFTSSKFFN